MPLPPGDGLYANILTSSLKLAGQLIYLFNRRRIYRDFKPHLKNVYLKNVFGYVPSQFFATVVEDLN